MRLGLEEFERNNCAPSNHDPVEYKFQLLRTWKQKLGRKATYGKLLSSVKRCLPQNQIFVENLKKLIVMEHLSKERDSEVSLEDTHVRSDSSRQVPSTSASVSLDRSMLERANALLELSIRNQEKFIHWTNMKDRVQEEKFKTKCNEVKLLTELVEKLKEEKDNLKKECDNLREVNESLKGAAQADEQAHLKTELQSLNVKAKEEQQLSKVSSDFENEALISSDEYIQFFKDLL